METLDCIATKLEVRQYSDRTVPADIKLKILDAARLTGSANNTQHWRFILLQGKESLNRLAEDSTTGKWVGGANFAIIIVTNPKVNSHMVDAGRAVQDMQLAAWDYGVGSVIFSGVIAEKVRKDFGIPEELQPSAYLGFGYPLKKILGKRKKRSPLSEVVFVEKFGTKFDPSSLK